MRQPTCAAAMSEAVLEAARAALAPNPAAYFTDPTFLQSLGDKNAPLVPLLMALLDAAFATAEAITDNAWDDGLPLDPAIARDLAGQASRIGAAITISGQAPNSQALSLPRFTGSHLL